MRGMHPQDVSGDHDKNAAGGDCHAVMETSLCKFFMNGLCNRGSQCLYSHSLQAKRPPCKFFFSLQVITVEITSNSFQERHVFGASSFSYFKYVSILDIYPRKETNFTCNTCLK